MRLIGKVQAFLAAAAYLTYRLSKKIRKRAARPRAALPKSGWP